MLFRSVELMSEQYVEFMFVQTFVPRQQVVPCHRRIFIMGSCGATAVRHGCHAERFELSFPMNGRAVLVDVCRHRVNVHACFKFQIERQFHIGVVMRRQDTCFVVIETFVVRIIPVVTSVIQYVDTEEIRAVDTAL